MSSEYKVETLRLSEYQIAALRTKFGPLRTGLPLSGLTIGQKGPVELKFSKDHFGQHSAALVVAALADLEI